MHVHCDFDCEVYALPCDDGRLAEARRISYLRVCLSQGRVTVPFKDQSPRVGPVLRQNESAVIFQVLLFFIRLWSPSYLVSAHDAESRQGRRISSFHGPGRSLDSPTRLTSNDAWTRVGLPWRLGELLMTTSLLHDTGALVILSDSQAALSKIWRHWKAIYTLPNPPSDWRETCSVFREKK